MDGMAYSGPESDEDVGATRDRRSSIPFSRRKELLRFAEELAETVMERVKPHEMCLLRRMVDGLVERHD